MNTTTNAPDSTVTPASTVSIQRDGDTLTFKHASDGNASAKVKDTATRMAEMDANGELAGGGLIKVNGPLLVPVAAVFGHFLAHRFSAVAFFAPPMNSFVVVSVHGHPDLKVGDVLPA